MNKFLRKEAVSLPLLKRLAFSAARFLPTKTVAKNLTPAMLKGSVLKKLKTNPQFMKALQTPLAPLDDVAKGSINKGIKPATSYGEFPTANRVTKGIQKRYTDRFFLGSDFLRNLLAPAKNKLGVKQSTLDAADSLITGVSSKAGRSGIEDIADTIVDNLSYLHRDSYTPMPAMDFLDDVAERELLSNVRRVLTPPRLDSSLESIREGLSTALK